MARLLTLAELQYQSDNLGETFIKNCARSLKISAVGLLILLAGIGVALPTKPLTQHTVFGAVVIIVAYIFMAVATSVAWAFANNSAINQRLDELKKQADDAELQVQQAAAAAEVTRQQEQAERARALWNLQVQADAARDRHHSCASPHYTT
ncbi:hypothetical protein FWF48_01655 [Candidatus Saccharibacteria bacterium]|nr:hypothetical protein [Candidatus Saccharibacteria bacterium]